MYPECVVAPPPRDGCAHGAAPRTRGDDHGPRTAVDGHDRAAGRADTPHGEETAPGDADPGASPVAPARRRCRGPRGRVQRAVRGDGAAAGPGRRLRVVR